MGRRGRGLGLGRREEERGGGGGREREGHCWGGREGESHLILVFILDRYIPVFIEGQRLEWHLQGKDVTSGIHGSMVSVFGDKLGPGGVLSPQVSISLLSCVDRNLFGFE